MARAVVQHLSSNLCVNECGDVPVIQFLFISIATMAIPFFVGGTIKVNPNCLKMSATVQNDLIPLGHVYSLYSLQLFVFVRPYLQQA